MTEFYRFCSVLPVAAPLMVPTSCNLPFYGAASFVIRLLQCLCGFQTEYTRLGMMVSLIGDLLVDGLASNNAEWTQCRE